MKNLRTHAKGSQLSRRNFTAGAASLMAAGFNLPLFFSGCSNESEPPRDETLPGLKTALAWIPNYQFAGFWIALEREYFAQSGVRVDWLPGGPNTPAGPLRVASGEVALGNASNQRPVFEAIAKGNDLVILGSRYQRQAGGLLSLASNPIKSAEDIPGKIILGQSPSDADTIKTTLRLNKLPADEFRFIPTGSDPQALIEGQGHAMLAFKTAQPLMLDGKGLSAEKDYFFRTWDELHLPGYQYLLFAKRDFVKQNRKVLVQYLKAEIKGWLENDRDPSLGARLCVEKYGRDFGFNLANETRANQLQLPFLRSPITDTKGLFWVDRDRLQGPIYEALRAGGVTNLPDANKVIDMSILEEAHAAS